MSKQPLFSIGAGQFGESSKPLVFRENLVLFYCGLDNDRELIIVMPKSTNNNSIDEEQPPNGISKDDWIGTPNAVRKFIITLINSNQEQGVKPENYQPKWPVWVMLLANLVILIGLSFLLANKFVLPCISPNQVSELSVALILLVVVHLIWRAIGVPDPSNIKEIIKLKYIEIPVTHVITFFNEIHPWRFSSRFLVSLLIIFLITGSLLNLTRISPFHRGGSLLAIPSFEVMRSNFQPSEQLPPGGILELVPGEKAVITLTILGKTQVSCTWFTASGSRIIQQGCTILLDVPTSVRSDIVTVFIQPICGAEEHSASLNVIVQP